MNIGPGKSLGDDAMVVDRQVIIRQTFVDWGLSRQQMLDSTGFRKSLVDRTVVQSMTRYQGGKVTMCFLLLHRFLSPEQLEIRYNRWGLLPDAVAHMAVNRDHPGLAKDFRNSVQWMDGDGKHCFVSFFGDEVVVRRRAMGWNEGQLVAGIINPIATSEQRAALGLSPKALLPSVVTLQHQFMD